VAEPRRRHRGRLRAAVVDGAGHPGSGGDGHIRPARLPPRWR
jgi:hypothetical protein